jgi:tRNA dimethylallyltransferase
MKPKVLVILGPTASGKSDLAVALAKRFNGEIISADSRQVYKGLDIGTGKITRPEMKGVPHHLLDVASPKKIFTAAEYQKRGAKAIHAVLEKGKLPIICGGTGLYIDALVYNYSFPSVKPNLSLRKKLEAMSLEALFQKLEKLDPERAKTIDRNNPRRLIRALEIILETGKPVPKLAIESPYEVLALGIRISETELKKRIKKRLLSWFEQGFLREVKRLIRDKVPSSRFKEFGLEYKNAFEYVKGNMSRDEMLSRSEAELYQYAKRQMTWFKRDKKIRWVQSEKEAMRLLRAFL